MTIKKILLVDDSKTELHLISDLLGKRGYSGRTAENGDEAMRRLAEDKPDLILMDVVIAGTFTSRRGYTDKWFYEGGLDRCTQPAPLGDMRADDG